MSINYSIAELYKLIRDNPNDSNYLQLLEEKIKLVTVMFQNVLLTDIGLLLINSNEKFKQAVKEKLIYFYNENHLFEPYRWYRKIFNERIPIYKD